jgi:hypothetical protein
MQNFYEYNAEQGYLLPPNVREALGKRTCVFSCMKRWRNWI